MPHGGSRRPTSRAIAWAFLTVALCTLINGVWFGRTAESNLILLYFLALLAVSLRGNLAGALFAAVLSVASFDFFFVHPHLSLAVDNVQYLFTFFVMGLVGAALSTLSSWLVAEIDALRHTQRELARHADELDHANRELREAGRHKDEFLDVISHEFRTPLSAVIGYGSLLAEGDAGALNDEQAAYLAAMLDGAERMCAMVANLIDLSRIQAGRFTLSCSAASYDAVVNEALEGLGEKAAEKGISLEVAVKVPGEVLVDGERVSHVIRNLVDNAIKFTPAGGRIEVRAFVEGDDLITEVRDTGMGIPQAALENVFERFRQADMSTTRETGGLGIGLAVSKALVEAHGGHIGVMQQAEGGSRFWFSLPLAPVPAAPGTA